MYAAQIWEVRFARDPLSRSSGRFLRDHMLRHGAARDTQSMLATLAADKLDPTYFLKNLL